MRFPWLLSSSLVAVVVFFVPEVLAQTVTLNGPSNVTVADADEYFSDVFGEGRNFDDPCDIGFDGWYFEPESSTNGIWTGVHQSIDRPNIGILPIPTVGTQLAYREDCGRLGLHYPLNADKYTRMSYKVAVTASSSYSVLWSNENNYAINGFGDIDGYLLNGPGVVIPPASNQFSIKNHDMKTRDNVSNLEWTGNITGISVWPSNVTQPAGSQISFDWMRVIDPTTSPTVGLSWTTVGSSGQPASDRIMLYVDNNNSGYDGILLEHHLPTTGTMNYLSGVLAPGTYYFYVRLETDEFNPIVAAQSNYIGPVVINGKPDFTFRSPTRFSGPEYSRDELGDAWDMNESTDVINLSDANRGFHTETFNNGYFGATTVFDQNQGTVDTQVHLNVPSNKPVNTDFYRYFCYRMQVDPQNLARNGDAVQLDRSGWVARLVYVKGGVTNGLGSTKAHELIERSNTFPDFAGGFTTFCIDMWDAESYESGANWRDLDSVTLMRFDPLEAADETPFLIDWAGLYAENENTSNNRFNIEWTVDDPENDSMSISLYYDTNNSGFDGTLITTLNGQTDGDGSYDWNVSSVSAGAYYIYAVINDGTNTKSFYTHVPVNIRAVPGIQPVAAATPCDFDGDGITDPAIVRGPNTDAEATWFIRESRTGAARTENFGSRRHDIFLGLDADGDRVADETLARGRVAQYLTWISRRSATAGDNLQGWGFGTDVPVVADIDGDNKDDLTVFRPQDGSWWSIRTLLGPIGLFWGLPGDLPAAADFDGDRWDDIAIFRPQDGTWWILQSSRAASTAYADIIFRQFGLPGDHPMPGDYDGDGTDDIVIWRPSSGHWFMCTSGTNFDCSQATIIQFGLPGDNPIKGDFDGDGKLDPAIFRPGGGYWIYLRSSDSQVGVLQFGLPGDLPLCTGVLDNMSLVQ